ncbi:lantibiotic dehydratase C-terminal domain-containing protein [Actinoplanes aureus]|uniref:Thiopeptide-type bacteriocin biosynthesis domain-containing protein n=1 Tax=Actinoplanes aureus TaxID=2792083 RepID=A0A931G0Q0_9ACTN|nr:lantibiotic dehydratase C-terminal domain-containing protein [Actinoplanes aureus]MBG0567028.1 hypothetical protein [Actinoplanes aureus]
MIWRDVVVHYHDPVKAPLLREAILPALDAVPPGVGVHLERGWLHGPHIRMRLAGPDDTVWPTAAGIAAAVRGYLAIRPSRVRLSHTELLAASTAAGRAELVPAPYEPFAADNSVLVCGPDAAAVARVPGGPRTAAVRAALLRAGLPALSATLTETGMRGDTDGARVRSVIVALAAHAAAGPWRLRGNYLSYQSHLELHLHHHDRTGRIRAVHDDVWRRHGDATTALVRRSTAAGGLEPLSAAWYAWGTTARRIAAGAYDRGVLRSASPQDGQRRFDAFGDAELVAAYVRDGHSLFHRLAGERRREPAEQRLFEIERFCNNVLYLLLAVADVTPTERYLATSMVCAAAQRLTGRSWREAVVDPAGAS